MTSNDTNQTASAAGDAHHGAAAGTGLSGKVALITGGSRGIGAAIATRLAAAGADVAVTYHRRPESAQEVTDQIKAVGGRGLAVHADSADPEAIAGAVAQTVATFGGLDILVNNAGVFPHGPMDEVTREEFDRTFAIHAGAAFFAAQAAVGRMRDGGRIISIGSCLVGRVPHPGVTLYSMSKSALIGLTKGLARDLGDRGITVNLVHPGPVDTDMNPADGPAAAANRAQTALGRYGTSDEVAATVAHLAGADGRWITGAEIAVDGGYTA
jgi:NAD(P)-dependent dehydrogenase (short-subunit alcohol dehydrogenase family)